MIEINNKIKAWIDGVELEKTALNQLINVSSLPFIYKHIAVMPDVHFGKGCTIGSVIPTIDVIIPAAVGVDIGCGMSAVKTNLKAEDLPYSLINLRSKIESLVPHGRTNDGKHNDKGAWQDENIDNSRLKNCDLNLLYKIVEKHPKIEDAAKRVPNHIGTLGSGNHFIEICLDEKNYVWIMLHSGSRGIGNRIGSYFIELAKNDMKKHMINLPDSDLAYLTEGSDYFLDYVYALNWSQNFAKQNRKVMMEATIKALKSVINKNFNINEIVIDCHHNYVKKENHYEKEVWLTRKGAVFAGKDVLGIIPGSMGAKSFIVKGKGNLESFLSCSHGAGRKISRTEDNKKFTIEDHIKATKGVECRKDVGVIDETPMAYKDIEAVMKAQSDLVEIVYTLKQILCVKG